MRSKPLKLAGKIAEHRPAFLVAHRLAPPVELGVVCLEEAARAALC